MVGCTGRAGAGPLLDRIFQPGPHQRVERQAADYVNRHQSAVGKQQPLRQRSPLGRLGNGTKTQHGRLRRFARPANGHRICTAAVLQSGRSQIERTPSVSNHSRPSNCLRIDHNTGRYCSPTPAGISCFIFTHCQIFIYFIHFQGPPCQRHQRFDRGNRSRFISTKTSKSRQN